MKIETFKPGEWRQQYQYRSFSPTLVNHAWTWEDSRINILLEQATRALGELNGLSGIVPNIGLFIRMHIVKEANQSSRIEGTQTAMDEAVMSEDLVDPERRDDWREVQNYIRAMNDAIDELAHLPLSNRLLRQTHAVLMQGVRDEHKMPGEFRTTQNWIGGSSLKDAAFIPPHAEELPELMGDLESFWHNEMIEVPDLIRIAISHYQFETIHPFCDGNGRIGRLLITLYLVSKGLLDKPSLYLSDFFEKNRASYYDALMMVRTSGNLAHWIHFFLEGVAGTANKAKETFRQIFALRREIEEQLSQAGEYTQKVQTLLNKLYQFPFMTVKQAMEVLNVSQPTANRILRQLHEMGVLSEDSSRKRNRVFVFERYLRLFMD